MAFHDLRFPEKISTGAVGGATFSTDIVSVSSGLEKRNQRWENIRHVYDVAHGIKTQQELDEIKTFFLNREGRSHSFRFKDWSDFIMPKQSIGLGNGVISSFQIYKNYQSNGFSYIRNLEKIVDNTYFIYVDNQLQTLNIDYSIDLLTGVITFISAPSLNASIEVACEFDVPVRFDTDQMRVAIQDYDIYTWGQIPLIEVKGG